MTTTTQADLIGRAEILSIAYDLVEQHLPGWRFQWDMKAVVRLGQCDHRAKRISLTYALCGGVPRATIIEVLLHEIAHALVGPGHKHDKVWVAQHLELGGTGRASYSNERDGVTAVPYPFIGTCPNCGREKGAHRRTRIACSACCRRHNGGRFAARFMFEWRRA